MGFKKTMFQPIELRLSDVERGRLVGLIDGEGYIGIGKSTHTNKNIMLGPTVAVANTSKLLIDYLHKLTGIGIVFKRSHHNRPRARDCWFWSVNKFGEIRGLLKEVSPFLIVKRKQAELMLKFISLRQEDYRYGLKRDERGRVISSPIEHPKEEFEIYAMLKTLNRRGRRL